MSTSTAAHEPSRLAYPATFAALALALAFPISLMIFNPTLMFERGWEQYVGTLIYGWALIALTMEVLRLRREERAFAEAPSMLARPGDVSTADGRVLPSRLRQLGVRPAGARAPSPDQLMELNREASGLDQEHAAGRFTLPRYILYLLPVIGFIGTVEGISKALMNISRVLPMVKDLDGFMSNLTSVTSALQVAFDSTLLALFLSASLMFVLTLVTRRSDDVLARVDRWIMERALPVFDSGPTTPIAAELIAVLGPKLDALAAHMADLASHLGQGFGPHVERFAETVDRLPATVAGFQRGADAIGRIGESLGSLGEAGDSMRRGVAVLARIEAQIGELGEPDERMDAVLRGIDRTGNAIEAMSQSWAAVYERSNRATQEQLARTLGSLKDTIDLLQVSMEQGNTLYRNIVKKMIPTNYGPTSDERAA
ncbi:MotA/TolQ/ExbB proton channel family protein [Isosphaeraceae bacterium EP7]